MKPQPNRKIVPKLNNLRLGVLASIAEMDLKGTDLKVTQAMCIVEEAFNTVANGQKLIPQRVFLSGMAKAQLVAQD